MLSKNTELLYWQNDDSWFYYDEGNEMYYLTDSAPERAISSYNAWKEFNNLK